MDDNELAELAELDAAGYRAIATLWPGDKFYYRGEFRTITKLQMVRSGLVWVHTEHGSDHLFDPWLLFPSILTDEHFQAEHGSSTGQQW